MLMLKCIFVVSYLKYITHDKSISPEFTIDVTEYVLSLIWSVYL